MMKANRMLFIKAGFICFFCTTIRMKHYIPFGVFLETKQLKNKLSISKKINKQNIRNSVPAREGCYNKSVLLFMVQTQIYKRN